METIISLMITFNAVVAGNDPTNTDPSIMLYSNSYVTTVKVEANLPNDEKIMLKAKSNGEYECCLEQD